MGNSFSTTTASGSSIYTVTLGTARTWLDNALFRGMVGTGDTARQDQAIEQAVNYVLERTKCNRTTTTYELTAGTHTYDTNTIVSGLRSEYILDIRVDDWYTVEPTSFRRIVKLNRGTTSVETGRPLFWASEHGTSLTFWPSPESAYEAVISYWSKCVSLASSGTIINCPREYLLPAVHLGASALLEHNDPAASFQSVAWQRFVNEVDRMSAASNIQVYGPTEGGIIDFDRRQVWPPEQPPSVIG